MAAVSSFWYTNMAAVTSCEYALSRRTLRLNGPLEVVPPFFIVKCHDKADISPRGTDSAGPKGVRFGER